MNFAPPLLTKPAVLLIDDDRELLNLLRDYLDQDGFEVSCAYDGEEGVRAALAKPYNIVVLDVMMPKFNGFEVLAQIRATTTMPVLMLTARGDDADRIAGLEQGADDYVSKPCSPRELAARLRAILKRGPGIYAAETTSTTEHALSAGSLMLWPALRRAEENGLPLHLTSTEFSLLELLVRHVGTPVSKDRLSEEALCRPLARFDRSVDVHIHSIRNKLKPTAEGRSRIQTIIRKGYLLLTE